MSNNNVNDTNDENILLNIVPEEYSAGEVAVPFTREILEDRLIHALKKKHFNKANIYTACLFIKGWEKHWWKTIIGYYLQYIGIIGYWKVIQLITECSEKYTKMRNLVSRQDKSKVIDNGEIRNLATYLISTIVSLKGEKISLVKSSDKLAVNIDENSLNPIVIHYKKLYEPSVKCGPSAGKKFMMHVLKFWQLYWVMFEHNRFRTVDWAGGLGKYMNIFDKMLTGNHALNISGANYSIMSADYKKIPKKWRDHPVWTIWLFIHSNSGENNKLVEYLRDLSILYLKMGGNINSSAYRRLLVESSIISRFNQSDRDYLVNQSLQQVNMESVITYTLKNNILYRNIQSLIAKVG